MVEKRVSKEERKLSADQMIWVPHEEKRKKA